MINFSYTLSPYLRKELDRIEELRDHSLLLLLSPSEELQMKYTMHIERIIKALIIQRISISQTHVESLLRPEGKKNTTPNEKTAIAYKKAYDYIYYSFFLTPGIITFKNIEPLYKYISEGSLVNHKSTIETILQFLQVKPEHPIIQAGIAYILFYHALGQSESSRIPALLMSYLFLYKHGYYFRGTLILEDYISQHSTSYFEVLHACLARKNISAFLDHFVFGLTNQAEKSYRIISERKFTNRIPSSYFELTERQKEILSLLDRPSTRITNKTVQQQFKVSQITASRELSKLTSLGLLIPLGKGRSVYYTKI